MLVGRAYEVEDDGDDFHLSLLVDGVQVGGAVFPGEYCGDARSLAHEMGEAFINNTDGLTIH